MFMKKILYTIVCIAAFQQVSQAQSQEPEKPKQEAKAQTVNADGTLATEGKTSTEGDKVSKDKSSAPEGKQNTKGSKESSTKSKKTSSGKTTESTKTEKK